MVTSLLFPLVLKVVMYCRFVMKWKWGSLFQEVSIRQYTGMRSQKSASTMVARLRVAVGGPGGLTEYLIIL